MNSITSRDLAVWRASWSTTGLTPQTFNKNLRHVRSMLRDLDDLDILPGKLPRCGPLPENDPEVRIGSLDEIERLYEHATVAEWPAQRGITPPQYWRALLVLAYTTGLRRSDMLAIRPADVSLKQRQLVYRAVKTGKLRTIPLTQACCLHLATLMKAAVECSGYVFYSTKSKRQFYREWERIQDAGDIWPRLDVHDLRKTCGSRVYEKVGLNAASELLAHSSLAVTRKHYISGSVASEGLRPAVDAIPLPDNVRLFIG